MNETYEEVLDVLKMHKKDGYEVPAVRVPSQQVKELISDESFMRAKEIQNADMANDDAIGLVFGTEVIPDDSISGIVANDVQLIEGRYDYDKINDEC